MIKLVCGLVGGLGLFLLGMKNMSDGMQAVAGASLRRLIGAVTGNRFAATVVGTIVTCIVQSSSVTTVMVVGFVNSGVMQLTQGVGVIMGANIGTTITGWVLVLNIGKHGLPILGLAAIVHLFSRGDRWRYWAMTIMGIGMIFFGLELMKEACAIIKEMPAFEAWFKAFDAEHVSGCAEVRICRMYSHDGRAVLVGDTRDHDLSGDAGNHQLRNGRRSGAWGKHRHDHHGFSGVTRNDHKRPPCRLFSCDVQYHWCHLDYVHFSMVHR